MLRLIKADNGMNILGQGIWIILVTLPAAGAAVAVHLYAPDLVQIPLPQGALGPLGLILILAGFALWVAGVIQLLVGFSRGKLVSSGAYGVCRNPIYCSFGFFILPGISLLTGTWVYILVSAVLLLAVRIFIRKEEEDLLRVFGDEYRRYMERVHRVIPFLKPR